jgi:hypothetical protein
MTAHFTVRTAKPDKLNPAFLSRRPNVYYSAFGDGNATCLSIGQEGCVEFATAKQLLRVGIACCTIPARSAWHRIAQKGDGTHASRILQTL